MSKRALTKHPKNKNKGLSMLNTFRKIWDRARNMTEESLASDLNQDEAVIFLDHFNALVKKETCHPAIKSILPVMAQKALDKAKQKDKE